MRKHKTFIEAIKNLFSKQMFYAINHSVKGILLIQCTWKNKFPQQRTDLITETCWSVLWGPKSGCNYWNFQAFFVCLFDYLFVCASRFAYFTIGKWSNHDSKNCSEIRTVMWWAICLWKSRRKRLLRKMKVQWRYIN